MECTKCKAKLPNDTKYCIRCGELFDYSYVTEEKATEDVLFEYIVKEKKYNTNFSVEYFLFNFAYAFYKKMYVEGIISFVAVLGLISILSSFLQLLTDFMGFSFLAIMYLIIIFSYLIINYIFTFNKLYEENICKFVSKLVIDNKDASFEQLRELCKERKQNNLFLALLSIFVFVIMFYIIVG